jgi:hypothetical protein
VPGLAAVYDFKQRLCASLSHKPVLTKMPKLASQLLSDISELRQSGFTSLAQLGDTFHAWAGEIAAMWRYTKTMASRKVFTPKWNYCNAKPTVSAISKTIACALR